jgi:hypothetical protein
MTGWQPEAWSCIYGRDRLMLFGDVFLCYKDAMAGTYEPLARRLCRSVNELGNGVSVPRDQVAKALKGAPDELVEGAITFALQKGWIKVEGRPVHSLMLTPDGEAIGQKTKGYPYGPPKTKARRVAPKQK